MTDGIDRTVVVTPYGKRYHRVKNTQRSKYAACGGFVQTNLSRIPQSEALEQEYSPCNNCSWEPDPDRDERGDQQ